MIAVTEQYIFLFFYQIAFSQTNRVTDLVQFFFRYVLLSFDVDETIGFLKLNYAMLFKTKVCLMFPKNLDVRFTLWLARHSNWTFDVHRNTCVEIVDLGTTLE